MKKLQVFVTSVVAMCFLVLGISTVGISQGPPAGAGPGGGGAKGEPDKETREKIYRNMAKAFNIDEGTIRNLDAEFEKGGDLRPLGDYLFWDDNISYHYFRWVSERELILGGEDRPLGGIRSGDNQFENLEKFLKSMTESKFSVRHKWQGAIFNTLDNLPYIGRHPAFGENIYFAFGFGGNGITFGTLGGKIIYDQIMGRENKFAKTFSFVRL